MKIILHVSISADGYIAKLDGDSDWVSKIDCDLFLQRIAEAGSLIVGRKTFEQYHGDLYPRKGAVNVVITTRNDNAQEEGTFFAGSPEEAIRILEQNGCDKAILAGGGHVNTSFLDLNLIDEIYFTVHPLLINQGIKAFEGAEASPKLTLLNTREISEGLVELHYSVNR